MTGKTAATQHVLLVEDSAAERMRLKAMLERAGYSVSECVDGQAAFEALQEQSCDLILSDWQMPRLDGVQLCQKIRGELGLEGSYFIMLTGRDSRADLLAAFAAGIDDFLAKPVNHDELFARLRAGQRVCDLRARLARENDRTRLALNREREAKRLLDEDIAAAGTLQQALLPPRQTELGDFEIATFFQPAAILGGDMLNYLPLRNGWVAFFLLDVCGHGAASALLSFAVFHALTQWLEDCEPTEYARPDQLLERLNQRFRDRSETARYFTIVLGLMDLESGRGYLSHAAHPPPLQLRDGLPAATIPGGGLPVGIFSPAHYNTHEFYLAPGDCLALFTDGATECVNAAGEELGSPGLARLLEDGLKLPATQAITALHQKLQNWSGQALMDDDVSVLLLRRSAGDLTAFTRHLHSEAVQISGAVDDLRKWLAECGHDENFVFQCCVSVAEALNNVHEHAYSERETGDIELICQCETRTLQVLIRDWGEALQSLPDSDLNATETEHGRGWFIIQSWMDTVELLDCGNANVLKLVKNLRVPFAGAAPQAEPARDKS